MQELISGGGKDQARKAAAQIRASRFSLSKLVLEGLSGGALISHSTPVWRQPVEALQQHLCWQRSDWRKREEPDGEMMDGVRRRRTAGDEGQSLM